MQSAGPEKGAKMSQIRLVTRLKNFLMARGCIQFETGFSTIGSVWFKIQRQFVCTPAPSHTSIGSVFRRSSVSVCDTNLVILINSAYVRSFVFVEVKRWKMDKNDCIFQNFALRERPSRPGQAKTRGLRGGEPPHPPRCAQQTGPCHTGSWKSLKCHVLHDLFTFSGPALNRASFTHLSWEGRVGRLAR